MSHKRSLSDPALRSNKRLRLLAPVDAIASLASAGLDMVCYGAAVGYAVYNTVGALKDHRKPRMIENGPVDCPPPYHLHGPQPAAPADNITTVHHHIHHYSPLPQPASAPASRTRQRRPMPKRPALILMPGDDASSETEQDQDLTASFDELEAKINKLILHGQEALGSPGPAASPSANMVHTPSRPSLSRRSSLQPSSANKPRSSTKMRISKSADLPSLRSSRRQSLPPQASPLLAVSTWSGNLLDTALVAEQEQLDL